MKKKKTTKSRAKTKTKSTRKKTAAHAHAVAQSTPQFTQPAIAELDLHEAEKAQPDWVRAELEAVRKYEDKILNALADEENSELFARDPGSFLRKLNIPISGALRQRMRNDDSLVELKKSQCFELPNGQHLRPRVRIRFTREQAKGSSDHGQDAQGRDKHQEKE